VAKDAKTRAKARALFEAGQSLRDVSKAVHIALGTVQKWAKTDAWEKGKSETKLARKAEESLEREAERFGLTKSKVFAKVAELIDAKSLAVITTQGAVSLAPMLPDAKTEGGKGDFMGIQYDVVPDRKTQMEAAKLAADVLKMKGASLDITSGGRSLLDEVLDET
jgi:hypothetical protein